MSSLVMMPSILRSGSTTGSALRSYFSKRRSTSSTDSVVGGDAGQDRAHLVPRQRFDEVPLVAPRQVGEGPRRQVARQEAEDDALVAAGQVDDEVGDVGGMQPGEHAAQLVPLSLVGEPRDVCPDLRRGDRHVVSPGRPASRPGGSVPYGLLELDMCRGPP